MTEPPKGKPRHDKTPVHDLIVEFKCPKCETIHHLPILVDRVQMLERDELGQLVKDEQGSYIPIRWVSFEYGNAPRVHQAIGRRMRKSTEPSTTAPKRSENTLKNRKLEKRCL